MNQQPESIPTEKSGHFYWLDLIRFLCALDVVIAHYRDALFPHYYELPESQQNIASIIFYTLTRNAQEAVMIFFMLSGFLVGGRAMERIINGTFRPATYATDRATRIMIPLAASYLLCIPVYLLFGYHIELFSWVGTLLSLQGILVEPPFGVFWSLSYEVWFYIFMGAIGYIIMYRGCRKAIYGIMALFVVSLVFTRLDSTYLFMWLIGAAGYFIVGHKSKLTLIIAIITAAVAWILLDLFLESKVNIGFTTSPAMYSCFKLLFAISFTIFMSQVVRYVPAGRTGRLVNSIGTRLAAFSYTLYLTHMPVLRLLSYFGLRRFDSFTTENMLCFIGSILLAVAVAYLMYLPFERNTPKVRRFLNRRIAMLKAG